MMKKREKLKILRQRRTFRSEFNSGKSSTEFCIFHAILAQILTFINQRNNLIAAIC